MSRTIIDANRKRWIVDFAELRQYKDLFITMTLREFKVRYAQTSLGILWAVIQPLLTLLILTLVFGKFIHVDTGNVPHIVFTIVGMSLWTFFSFTVMNAGNSIIASQNMIKKVYFPRIIIPISKSLVGLIDLGISFLILIALMVYYQVPVSGNVWAAPIFIVLGLLCALSLGILISALTIRFRDFQYIVPFIVQIGLYVTPIAYPASFAMNSLPKWAANLYYLNPMTGVIEGFRWSLFGTPFPGSQVFISFGVILVFCVLALVYFKRIEDEMADYV